MQLAVGVAHADVVGIDQGQLADAAARQRLHRPRADAAQADHADPLAGQGRRALAIKPVDAGKTLFQQRIHPGIVAVEQSRHGRGAGIIAANAGPSCIGTGSHRRTKAACYLRR